MTDALNPWIKFPTPSAIIKNFDDQVCEAASLLAETVKGCIKVSAEHKPNGVLTWETIREFLSKAGHTETIPSHDFLPFLAEAIQDGMNSGLSKPVWKVTVQVKVTAQVGEGDSRYLQFEEAKAEKPKDGE